MRVKSRRPGGDAPREVIGVRRARSAIRILLVASLAVAGATGTVAGFGNRESSSPVPSPAAEEDVVVLDGGALREGALVRVRGRIDIYGNTPLTFPAIRTDAPAGYTADMEIRDEETRDEARVGAGGAEERSGAVWLLELSGADPEVLEEYGSGLVLVEGVLRRIPQGPRWGLLEVQSLERVR